MDSNTIDNFIKGIGLTLIFADSKIKDDPDKIFNIFPKVFHYDIQKGISYSKDIYFQNQIIEQKKLELFGFYHSKLKSQSYKTKQKKTHL